MAYTLYDLQADMAHLSNLGAETGVIGKTYLGRRIPYAFVGSKRGPQIIIQGAIHGREHITAKLVVMQAYRALARGLEGGGVYFVPMVNIDGVMLCIEGISSVPDGDVRQRLVEINGGFDFSLWKANANAVDLNVNFDARWGTGLQNVRYPAPENYIGPYPESEPETQSLVKLTDEISPALTISYHSKGQIIFWQFYQDSPELERDRAIGGEFAAATGYALIDGEGGSAGGYKDWCIERFKIPAYTFEIVNESYEHPVDYSALEDDWVRNRDIPELSIALAGEIRNNNRFRNDT